MIKKSVELTFAGKVIKFNSELDYKGSLPDRIRILNPFKHNEEILAVSSAFYRKFYTDNNLRKLILGINPGRLGAGATGIPFTDTKRLSDICKIKIESFATHEPSSVFIYELIEKYGGAEKFYSTYFINSVCPLGFIIQNKKGNWVNCNYYDYEELLLAVKPLIIESLKKQIRLGIDTRTCFVLGRKNAAFLKLINDKEKLFESIVVFDHPRYIIQYKSKDKDRYLNEYLSKLT